MKIGIVGLGCVGKAYAGIVRDKFSVAAYDIREYSKDDTKLVGSLFTTIEELVGFSDLIILTLPTPTVNNKNDLTSYEIVLGQLAELRCDMPIVIKSTILPTEITRLIGSHPELKLCYSPEFLTEKNALNDLIHSGMNFVAGDHDAIAKYQQFILQSKIKNKAVRVCDNVATLSMMKYTINAFLTTKVSFFNGIYGLCREHEIDYDGLVELLRFDDRLGHSHVNVPGPDGKLGYGGMCFVKDIKAFTGFVELSDTVGLSDLLQSVQGINKQVRK